MQWFNWIGIIYLHVDRLVTGIVFLILNTPNFLQSASHSTGAIPNKPFVILLWFGFAIMVIHSWGWYTID